MKKIILLISVLTGFSAAAREKAGSERVAEQNNSLNQKVMSNCAVPKASKELWVNNVRTIIYSGGDMWWDLFGNGNAYYIVPAVQNRNTGVSSSFAGSIWLGGLDAGGQLKVAAMTYRQNGIDFWPGPLDTTNASADPGECLKYDQLFTLTRAEVDNFVGGGAITTNILNWPGNGDVSKKQGRNLAPFIDVNFDNVYDPTTGDYPAYDVKNTAEKDANGFCKTKLYGDNTLFWVFNDKGGIHSETQGVPIGVEVRAQAFGFKTNDEINNMTFYSYQIHNRSSFQLNSTYFTIWNDADLGYYLDDYVGCDVARGLGYIYNADPFDETASGANGYQDYPPAFGCDFFKGPLADPFDGIDNDGDGMDESIETIQMSRFTYYNNNIGAFPPQTTNPDLAIHFYNFMTGFWKDGSPFTQGGNAYGGTSPAQFVYDGDPVAGTGWTEKGAGNLPGDRRFLQSAGPFTLKPGAVNDITFGMPWAQSPTKGGNIESIRLLRVADDKAQRLFDNCFKILDGPEAPNMTVQEVENELIIYLTNEKGSSNNFKIFNNDYEEEDITIISDPTSTVQALANPDKFYRFEGYIVYQVRDDNVTSTDLSDRTKAIPIFQCDLKNNVSRLVNYVQDNNIGALVPQVMVDGANNGISSTFRVTEDAFSTSENRKLINHRTYYFIAVAYAFNNYLTYAPDVSPQVSSTANYLGQKRPYLEGRKIKRAAGVPRNPSTEKDGTLMQSAYGFGPKITRIEGQGNGGNMLTLTKESEDFIVANFFKPELTYENAQGPLNIKVVDPLNVKDANFTFRFINNTYKSVWTPTIDPTYSVTPTTPREWWNAMPSPVPNATNNATGNGAGLAALNVDRTSWELKDESANKIYHPNEPQPNVTTKDTLYQTIKVGNEFYFQELGFSINVKQVGDVGEQVNSVTLTNTLTSDYAGPEAGSFIGSSVNYANGPSGWLNALQDVDGNTPANWILSGNNKTSGNEDAYYTLDGEGKVNAFYDPQKQFGKVAGGTWAPYSLASAYYPVTPSAVGFPARNFGGPGFTAEIWDQDQFFKSSYNIAAVGKDRPYGGNTDMRKLSSVLVVYTKDRSKWTRCVVLEMQEKSNLSEGFAPFFSPRKHASVDKNGNIGDGVVSNDPNDADFVSATGMGWFPGYAINIETGERLNMAFGEDSYQKENNGNDMLWNPTASLNSPYPYAFGGKHFVYVFAGNTVKAKFRNTGTYYWEDDLAGDEYGVGPYDYGKRMMNILNKFFHPDNLKEAISGNFMAAFGAVERDIMWTSIPMTASGRGFKHPDQMPSDVRIQINVAKPYRYGYSGIMDLTASAAGQSYLNLNKLTSVNNPTMLTTHVKTTGVQNNNFPLYSFNTSDIATLYGQADVVKNAMDMIKIVPNPYYGSSAYEVNRIDNRIKITNLPNKCTIKIFTMNGTLVRTLKRDVSGQEDLVIGKAGTGQDIIQSKRASSVEWDLKNQNNITIASGLYIFHIDAPGVGEKVLKWFGVIRPLDVQNY
jgi:hypothetical protein